jgi:hypothetical protein
MELVSQQRLAADVARRQVFPPPHRLCCKARSAETSRLARPFFERERSRFSGTAGGSRTASYSAAQTISGPSKSTALNVPYSFICRSTGSVSR